MDEIDIIKERAGVTTVELADFLIWKYDLDKPRERIPDDVIDRTVKEVLEWKKKHK